jgi:hypothetical protein
MGKPHPICGLASLRIVIDKTKSGEKVHLYGCSIAYGVCVEDEDVFSNRLN